LINEFYKKIIKKNIIVKNIFIKSDLEVDPMQTWVMSLADINTKILTSLAYDPSFLWLNKLNLLGFEFKLNLLGLSQN